MNGAARVTVGGGRQRGVALLTVLLVVFLAAATATALLASLQLDLRRLQTASHLHQARQYALGMEAWAQRVLARDAQRGRSDHAGEAWARLPLRLDVDGGEVGGWLVDLEGRFNVNNLVTATGGIDAGQLALLGRLLAVLGLPPGLAATIADWVDADAVVRPGGAESADYALLDPPYGAPDRPLASVSELRGVRGLEPALYARLEPHVSVLPGPTPINVNTAGGALLAAVAAVDGAVPDPAALAARRPAQGYETVAAFLREAGIGDAAATGVALDVASRHFLLLAEARVGGVHARLRSVLERDGARPPRVLSRSFADDPG